MLSISKGSGKMLGIPSINTNTLSNSFCQHAAKGKGICSKCYSRKMLTTYRSTCIKNYEQNSHLLSTTLVQPTRLNFAYFRFHSHGELINSTHFENFKRIALYNPQTTFALWTKRTDLITLPVPSNLILIYSNPTIDHIIQPPFPFDKVFNVVKSGQANCNGKCIECLQCYKKDTQSTIIEVIK
jgi:hypothetical protein